MQLAGRADIRADFRIDGAGLAGPFAGALRAVRRRRRSHKRVGVARSEIHYRLPVAAELANLLPERVKASIAVGAEVPVGRDWIAVTAEKDEPRLVGETIPQQRVEVRDQALNLDVG